LRQSGILIISSTLVIWGLVFIAGLGSCGIEGAYFTQSQGAPDYAGVFTAWCNLREVVPYVFGYMMAAKVGTGIVAELGAMRISDEIDALEVMGVDSMTFLCATRLLAAWLVLPFMYIGAIGVAYLGSYIAVVDQVKSASSGGYFLLFWQFQNPDDFLFSLIKGMSMATVIVLVGCYYGYNASGGPVGVGTATAKSMVLNLVAVNLPTHAPQSEGEGGRCASVRHDRRSGDPIRGPAGRGSPRSPPRPPSSREIASRYAGRHVEDPGDRREALRGGGLGARPEGAVQEAGGLPGGSRPRRHVGGRPSGAARRPG
jgi:phospholipid/cholesterol/gamma-HCH transport system permease protein